MSDVRLFKLLSGEFVISETEYNEKTDSSVLTSPAQISMQQGDEGRMQVGLLDFLPFAVEGAKVVTIKSSHVIYDHAPSADMLNAYNKIYGSGLILPGGAIARPGLRLV